MIFLLYSLSGAIIDQLVKLVFLKYYSSQVIYNQGIIFGFWKNFPIWLIYLFLFIVLVLVLRSKNFQIGFGLIFGGGLANLFDRIFREGVVDFDIGYFPNTNIADLLIIAGLIYICWSILFKKNSKG